MRKAGPAVVMALLLALLGAPGEARAGATVDLLFVGVNGIPIAPTTTVPYYPPGYEVTMVVRLRNDQPLTVAVFSLNYDLDGDNELDVVSAFQWRGLPIHKSGTDFFTPVTALEPTTASFVGSFQGATTNFRGPRVLPPAAGAFAGGYQMGTVTWKVGGSANSDGADIISGILNLGVDSFADGGFNDIDDQILFNGATIDLGDDPPPIPEPAAGALLGLGVAGLALLRRRARRER